MTEEAEVKKGLTLKTIVIGIILMIPIVTLGIVHEVQTSGGFGGGLQLGHLTYNMSWFAGAGINYYFYYPFGLFVLAAIIIAAINSIKPIFSRQEVAVLAVMIMASALVCGWYAYDSGFNNILGIAPSAAQAGQEWVETNDYWAWVPKILGPQDVDWWRARINPRFETTAVGPAGSGIVDWGTLTPTIVWYWLFLIGFCGTMGFSLLLLRRIYVDVEALQFPTMEMVGEVVESTQPGSKVAKFFTNWWFLGGLLVQAAWFAALILPAVFNPETGLGKGTTIDGEIGLIPGTTDLWFWPIRQHEQISTAMLPWVPLMISLPLWQVGWGVLLSLEVLVGVVIGWFIFWFCWPLVSSSMGYLPAYTPGGMQYTAWYPLWRNFQDGGANLVTVSLGFTVALALIPLWRNRATLIPILKGLWSEPAPEVDPNRPLPYRWVWIGVIACGLLTLAMGWVAQVMIAPLLVFLIVMTVINIGFLRMYAESGGWWGTLNLIPYHPAVGGWAVAIVMATLFKDTLWTHGATATLPMVMTFAIILPGLTSAGFHQITQRVGLASLGSFKIGSLTRTDAKDMAKSVAIAFGLGILVACIMLYGVIHFIGVAPNYGWASYIRYSGTGGWYFPRSKSYVEGDVAGIWQGNIAKIRSIPAEDLVVKFAIGFIVCIFVVFMRGRFAWFRISAAGLALGAFIGREMWSPLLVALIIKYIMLRVGGTKLYLEKLRPAAIGLVAGWAIMFAIGVFLTDYNTWLYGRANPPA